MAHVFVSYSHKDSSYAHKLAQALEQRGFSVWIDDRIDYGTQWPEVIEEHLDMCSAFIVIMTTYSKSSDWVQNELTRAKRKGKPIFPVLLEGEEPWLAVEATQYVDVRGGDLPPSHFYQVLEQATGPLLTQLLFYDSRIGLGEFYDSDMQAGIGLLLQHTDWRKSWRQIISGRFTGSEFTDLLFYDPTVGEGLFYASDGRGGIHLLLKHTGWRKSWGQIIPGKFTGSEFADLLFYDSTLGEGEFYASDGKGGIHLLLKHTGWRKSWGQIVPGKFTVSEFTDLLFYDPTVGEGLFYASDGRGGIHLLLHYTGWRRDWQAIVPL